MEVSRYKFKLSGVNSKVSYGIVRQNKTLGFMTVSLFLLFAVISHEHSATPESIPLLNPERQHSSQLPLVNLVSRQHNQIRVQKSYMFPSDTSVLNPLHRGYKP